MSVAAAVIAILAAVGVAVWNFALAPVEVTPRPSPTPTAIPTASPQTANPPVTTEPPRPTAAPPTTTEPPPPPPPPPTTEPPAEFPAGSRPCPAIYPETGGYRASAVGNNQTSCPFAEEVRLAYSRQPVRDRAVVVDAFSPVTGIVYTMTCQPGRLVTCTGGNNAVVHLI